MRFKQSHYLIISILVSVLFFFSSCLTSKKMDRFVSEQYNNQIPKLDKKKTPEIIVTSTIPSVSTDISNTVQKTSKVLPLIIYWQFDYRHTSTLNPAIAINNFTNTITTMASKGLSQKLNGKKLQLTVEQVPNAFALVDKAHIIWIIYAFSWDKIYMEPEFKDLVVSYQLLENDNTVKTGKISIKSNAQNKGVRYFQSWKSATSEYIAEYNASITNMAKSFITKLIEEL